MASYQYEQLNDQSFQHLCQSLLLKAFPDLQCLPVGQPDGGRDAFVRLFRAAPVTDRFMLFQVKFVKSQPTDVRKWLLKILKGELPKIKKQMESGAERFVLVTNAAGSAHSGTGSIDKLQELLDEHIPVPAQAWWRDDLDRRLDNSWDLKLLYPALLSGADLLRLIMEAAPSEDRQRRQNAIAAFLSGQFDSDREVKFKQAELENDIFDLFVDVPLVPRIPAERKNGVDERLAASFLRAATSAPGEVDFAQVRQWLKVESRDDHELIRYYPREEVWLGAVSLLLDRDFHQAQPLVILEGGPGQGKSTIAQYICQIHRMRLLDISGSDTVDSNHIASPIRIPFKVELRDFANWLHGRNPFGIAGSEESTDSGSRSLEAFISALVQHASGGSDFGVSDLQKILNASPALIVLDGLDEVAEISTRERVVEQISSAVSRLNGIAKSLQVVVTSRPTPFVNAAVLPRRDFATYSLESLTRPLVREYAERWLRSRSIDRSDAADVQQILDQQLNEPHLRDLARNPMQLAILLSLIHRRGESLPDKRTALYDNYVDMFFDRESEKAVVVKQNRDLLIRIHRYLAWILQSGAELDSELPSNGRMPPTSLSGTIAEADLKDLVRNFLEFDGSDASLVESLFGGMVERVVAIVSRVEGFYEFDVQTLREYFAARHLYQTAPYSPPGDQRAGTKSDRWRALSRNYYWLNVARFYAGCYDEGELLSLVEELRALREEDVFSCTSHPQHLTATLLGDWVFSQQPRTTQHAIDLLLEPQGLRRLIAGASTTARHVEDVIVRDPTGRAQLVEQCKQLIGPDAAIDQVLDVVWTIIHPNAVADELFGWWLDELRSSEGTFASRWCEIGKYLHCWSKVKPDIAHELLDRTNIPSSSVISGLLHDHRMDILENTAEHFGSALERILAGERILHGSDDSVLQRLAWSIEVMFIAAHHTSARYARRLSLIEYARGYIGFPGTDTEIVTPSFDVANRTTRVVQVFQDVAERPFVDWSTSIEPWHSVIQAGISEFGERRVFVELANLAAGVRSPEETCRDSPDLFDVDRPIVRRARYARLRAGAPRWWLRQLESVNASSQIWTALLFLSTWAGPRTIEASASSIDELVLRLNRSEWQSLHSSLRRVATLNFGRNWVRRSAIRVEALPALLDARTVTLIATRCDDAIADELDVRYLSDYSGDDTRIVSLRADVALRRALRDESEWSRAIDCLRLSYDLGGTTSPAFFEHMESGLALPESAARTVVADPLRFPAFLVWMAENRCRGLSASTVLPVGEVASREGWFRH